MQSNIPLPNHQALLGKAQGAAKPAKHSTSHGSQSTGADMFLSLLQGYASATVPLSTQPGDKATTEPSADKPSQHLAASSKAMHGAAHTAADSAQKLKIVLGEDKSKQELHGNSGVSSAVSLDVKRIPRVAMQPMKTAEAKLTEAKQSALPGFSTQQSLVVADGSSSSIGDTGDAALTKEPIPITQHAQLSKPGANVQPTRTSVDQTVGASLVSSFTTLSKTPVMGTEVKPVGDRSSTSNSVHSKDAHRGSKPAGASQPNADQVSLSEWNPSALYSGVMFSGKVHASDNSQTSPQTTTLSMDKPQWHSDLSAVITGMNARGQPELHVHVHPAGLGDIVISVTQQNSGVDVRVEASNSALAATLNQSLPELSDALKTAGLDVSSLQVMSLTSGTFSNDGQFGSNSQGHARERQTPSGRISRLTNNLVGATEPRVLFEPAQGVGATISVRA